MINLDETDKRLLAALAADARQSVATLARHLGLARTTLQARIERLERRGIIAGYTVKLGETARRGRIRVTVLLQVDPRSSASVVGRLRLMPEIEVIHTSSGRFDLVLQLACDTTAALDHVLDMIGEVPGILSSESLIHLSTKMDRAL